MAPSNTSGPRFKASRKGVSVSGIGVPRSDRTRVPRGGSWSRRPGLNRRPTDYESAYGSGTDGHRGHVTTRDDTTRTKTVEDLIAEARGILVPAEGYANGLHHLDVG